MTTRVETSVWRARRLVCFAAIAALMSVVTISTASPSQSPTQSTDRARIVGSVTDSSGSAIPGAMITLSGDNTSRSTTSQSDGTYSFEDVAIGIACRVKAALHVLPPFVRTWWR
ncbi:MAG TPA: carboxypeptidase-like regulatory domain-containing protein [Vicinamibacterales bacterium]